MPSPDTVAVDQLSPLVSPCQHPIGQINMIFSNFSTQNALRQKKNGSNLPYSIEFLLKHSPIRVKHVPLRHKFHVLFQLERHFRNPEKRHNFSVCNNLNHLVPVSSVICPSFSVSFVTFCVWLRFTICFCSFFAFQLLLLLLLCMVFISRSCGVLIMYFFRVFDDDVLQMWIPFCVGCARVFALLNL